jgi:hypothetical protein
MNELPLADMLVDFGEQRRDEGDRPARATQRRTIRTEQ